MVKIKRFLAYEARLGDMMYLTSIFITDFGPDHVLSAAESDL